MINLREAVDNMVSKDDKKPNELDMGAKKKEAKGHLEQAAAICDECGFDLKNMLGDIKSDSDDKMYSNKDDKMEYKKDDMKSGEYSDKKDNKGKSARISAAITSAKKKMG